MLKLNSLKIKSILYYKMPSGKLVRQNAVSDDSDYSPESTSSSSEEEE